jgi:hypothetical protein
VYLPKDSYVRQCAHAVGWHKYVAWALTAIGVLGLAISVAGASSQSGPEPTAKRRAPARSKNDSTGKHADTEHAGAEHAGTKHAVAEQGEVDEDAAEDEAEGPATSTGSGGAHRRR